MSDGQGELRELIVRELEEQSDHRAKQYWVEGTPLLYGDTAREVVDAVMAAIDDSGWKLVPPVPGSLACIAEECWAHDGHEWGGWAIDTEALDEPEDGDLDEQGRPSGGEAGKNG